MNEYYFLFGLAFLWTLFATIQDLKSREVANWLNFSFISSALAYRAFYSLSTKNHSFFLYGLAGLAIFFILANALYYSKVFAGGDAKLLMGYGIILPFQNITSLFFISLLFILLLFLAGAIYSIFYSFFIVSKNKIVFKKEFKEKAKKNRYVLISTLVIAIILLIYNPRSPINLALTIALLIPITYIYTKAIDKCMLKLVSPQNLTEGDWLERDVRIGNKTIKKTVHGLSWNEIKLLRKANKKVYIKEGIPFVPAFLIAFIIMALFFLILKFPLSELLSFLPS